MTHPACNQLTRAILLSTVMICCGTLCADDEEIDLSAFGVEEETPAAAPIATPAPVPVTPSVTPASVPVIAASTPPAATPVPVAPGTPAPVAIDLAAYKAEVDTINAQIQIIIAAKEMLKEQLKTIDSSIQESKDKVTASRKKSLEIINQKELPAAQALLGEIESNTKFITEQQAKIAAISDTQFQAEIAKIEAAKKLIDTQITQLKAKGVSIQVAQAQAEQAATTAELQAKKAAVPKRQFKSWFVKSKEATAGQGDDQQPTFIHFALKKIADGLSSAVQWIYETCAHIKASVWHTAVPATGTSTAAPAASAPSTTPTPLPAQPAPVVAVAAAQPSSAAGVTPAAASALASLEKQDSSTQALMVTQDKLATKIASVDSSVQALTHTLNSNALLAKSVVGEGALQTSLQAPAPAWKITTQAYFGMLLDGIHKVYSFITSRLGRWYYLYIAPLFIKVSSDVQKEVQKQTDQLVIPNAPVAPTTPASTATPIKAAA